MAGEVRIGRLKFSGNSHQTATIFFVNNCPFEGTVAKLKDDGNLLRSRSLSTLVSRGYNGNHRNRVLVMSKDVEYWEAATST